MPLSNQEREFVEKQIAARKFSPAAREMPLQRTIDQYNDANALDATDDEYMLHPDVERTTITTSSGSHIAGFGLKSNPNAKSDRSDVEVLRGISKLSRSLGSVFNI